jgi:hypothetical protein
MSKKVRTRSSTDNINDDNDKDATTKSKKIRSIIVSIENNVIII